MRKEYKEELEKLTIKMQEAEKFAKQLPIFEKVIIRNKYTGNEDAIRFEDRYKSICFESDIWRCLFQSNTRREIRGYSGKSYTKFLFYIRINAYSLFNHHYCNFSLADVAKTTPVFFYSEYGTTFYATDEQIQPLLDALNDWYLRAVKENEELTLNKRVEDAEKELEASREKLDELTKEG